MFRRGFKLIKKLEQLEQDLREHLLSASAPIVAWSGGKDSNLILYLSRKIINNIPVLAFPYFWDEHQKKYLATMVREWGLTVFFYRPSRLDFIQDSLIAFYKIGDLELPVIQDAIYTNKCGIELGNRALSNTPIPPFLWDTLITGTKSQDHHPQLKIKPNFNSFSTERLRIITPLADWTDLEVHQAIDYLKISVDTRVYTDKDETADTGNVNACFNCVKTPIGETVYCPLIRGQREGICQPSDKELKFSPAPLPSPLPPSCSVQPEIG